MLRKTLFLGIAASLALTATLKAESKDIVDTAVSAGNFKTLVAAVQAAGLVDALKADGPVTVLAPTDEAFSKLPAGTVETLLKPENKDQLVAILTYHVIPGKVPAAKVVNLNGAKTLNGQRVDIAAKDGAVTVDKAKVVATDIECSNGIIHVIDQVILPASDDIPTTASKAGSFKTLLAAAKAAGLAGALAGDGPFTVFAPTDEAFAKLPEGTVASLLEKKNLGKLADILKYHVVPGRVYSPEALSAGAAKTLLGPKVNIRVVDGEAKVNDAKLIATDIDASNGVIHVIDSVILPPSGDQAAQGNPRDVIVEAINTGAPLYNAQKPGQCAAIYMATMNRLMKMEGVEMSPHTMRVMKMAMAKAESTSCVHTQAWTLRHALDMAYNDVK